MVGLVRDLVEEAVDRKVIYDEAWAHLRYLRKLWKWAVIGIVGLVALVAGLYTLGLSLDWLVPFAGLIFCGWCFYVWVIQLGLTCPRCEKSFLPMGQTNGQLSIFGECRHCGLKAFSEPE